MFFFLNKLFLTSSVLKRLLRFLYDCPKLIFFKKDAGKSWWIQRNLRYNSPLSSAKIKEYHILFPLWTIWARCPQNSFDKSAPPNVFLNEVSPHRKALHNVSCARVPNTCFGRERATGTVTTWLNEVNDHSVLNKPSRPCAQQFHTVIRKKDKTLL